MVEKEKFKMETQRGNKEGNHQRGLGDIHRSEGCLLPCSDKDKLQEVPKVHGTRPGVPVQGASVRANISTERVHKGDLDACSYCTQEGG